MADTKSVTVPVEPEYTATDYLRLIAEGWEVIESSGSQMTIQNPKDGGPQEIVIDVDLLSAAPAPEGGAVDEERLKGVVSMLEKVVGPTASVRIYEHEAKLILSALRAQPPAHKDARQNIAKALEDFLVEGIEAWKINDAAAIDAAIEKAGSAILVLCIGEGQ